MHGYPLPALRAALVAAVATSALAGAGKDWGVESTTYTDPVTGVAITEITRGPHASDNLYFHFSNFTADDRQLLFVSDRTGTWQLYRAETGTGRIVQLTDDSEMSVRSACPDPTEGRRVFLARGRELVALDVVDATWRRVGTVPGPVIGGLSQLSLSHDGRALAVGFQRDAGTWEIGRVQVRDGTYQTVLRQGFRIGHVQHSPTAPVLFYVWETGGYAPQRTWLVNADGSGNRPFYARTDPKRWFTPLKEWVTHEAWVARTGQMTMVNDRVGIMLVEPDGAARIVREGHYWHAAASSDGRRLVADDAQGRLWLIEARSGEARLLATGLRETVKTAHPHPSFDHQGRYVQFHSGRARETVAWIDLTRLPAPPVTASQTGAR